MMGAALGKEGGQAGLCYGILQYGRKTRFCRCGVQLGPISQKDPLLEPWPTCQE